MQCKDYSDRKEAAAHEIIIRNYKGWILKETAILLSIITLVSKEHKKLAAYTKSGP
jgi:hypothetical protein